VAVADRPSEWPDGKPDKGSDTGAPAYGLSDGRYVAPDTGADNPTNAESQYEPTVGERIRLGQCMKAIDQLGPEELRDLAKRLAQMALMVYPAMIRGLAREAAQNLAGVPWGMERGGKMADELIDHFNRLRRE